MQDSVPEHEIGDNERVLASAGAKAAQGGVASVAVEAERHVRWERVAGIVFGIVSIGVGLMLASLAAFLLFYTGKAFYEGAFESQPVASLALFVCLVSGVGVVAVCTFILGVRLIRNKIRGAHLMAEIISVALGVCALCELMLEGVTTIFWILAASALFLSLVFTFADPALAEERRLQRVLRDMEAREEAEDGTLGRDATGRGYMAVNFFNLFWIFTIGAIFGDAVETVYHYMIEVPGEFQIRAGLLWGPFSPIYGFGAVLLSLMLNRFYKAPAIVIFLVSAVVGGAFEYFVSWFLEFAFGAVAWDYTGRFLNIGGRTDFMFMCMWGLLGVMWIKLILPWLIDVVNKIPWQWRYSLTAACAAFMIFDGVMTLIALDCWYMRLDGAPTDQTAFQSFFATHFDNAYMESRFQSMSLHPELTTRVH